MTDDQAFEVFARTELASLPGRYKKMQEEITRMGISKPCHLVTVEGSPDKDFWFVR